MSEKLTDKEEGHDTNHDTADLPSIEILAAIIIAYLADIRCCSEKTIKEDFASGNENSVVTAKEAMPICSRIEKELGCGPFIEPADLGSHKTNKLKRSPNGCMSPAEDTDIEKLAKIIRKKLKAHLSHPKSKRRPKKTKNL